MVDQTAGTAFHTACQAAFATALRPAPPRHIEPCGWIAMHAAAVLADAPARPSESYLAAASAALSDAGAVLRAVGEGMAVAVAARRAYAASHAGEFPDARAVEAWVSSVLGQWELSEWVTAAAPAGAALLRNVMVGPHGDFPWFQYAAAAFEGDQDQVRAWLATEEAHRCVEDPPVFVQEAGGGTTRLCDWARAWVAWARGGGGDRGMHIPMGGGGGRGGDDDGRTPQQPPIGICIPRSTPPPPPPPRAFVVDGRGHYFVALPVAAGGCALPVVLLFDSLPAPGGGPEDVALLAPLCGALADAWR